MTKGDEHACEALFGISVAFGFIAWEIVAALYFWRFRGAGLACVGCFAQRVRHPLVWIFNLWGSADLLYAFYQGNASGLVPGMLQATYFIPTFIVPLLLITHGLVFLILLRRDTVAVRSASR
jgi:hypothetical protein